MRFWSLLVGTLLLSLASFPTMGAATETHGFKLWPQSHRMLFEGSPAYSYGCAWSIEIPAPSGVPSSVDVQALSRYAYKYIALNMSEVTPLAGGFQVPTWSTTFELEGVVLGTIAGGHPGYPFVLQPQEYFWGPERPKVTERVQGAVGLAGGWPDPGGDTTWTLVVRAVSHFNIWSSGPLWFGQSMRQRVKGQVTYTY